MDEYDIRDAESVDAPFELKFIDTGKADDGTEVGEFAGLASTFNNIDLVGDEIRPGAFAQSIRNFSRIRMLWQHDHREPIGRWTDMKETQRGLEVSGQIFLHEDLPVARKAYRLLKERAIDSMSIGFRLGKGAWEFDNERGIRVLNKIDLAEISLVSMPANPKARVQRVKNLFFENKREFERYLREAGVPVHFAKLVTNHGFDEAMNRLSDWCEADGRQVDELLQAVKRRGEVLNRLSTEEHTNGRQSQRS